MRLLSFGDRVMLLDAKKRRYLLTLTDGGEFHSHAGFVPHAEIAGPPREMTGNAADTTVCLGDEIYGKPADAADARLKLHPAPDPAGRPTAAGVPAPPVRRTGRKVPR